MKRKLLLCAIAAAAFAAPQVSQAAVSVDFDGFNIRNSDGSIIAPWDAGMFVSENGAGDGFTASVPLSGQKVGYGTNAFDGVQINQIETVDFASTILGGKVPYLNMWVTDGTNFAIISSENDYRGKDFQTRQEWKVFEYDASVPLDLNWLFASGTGGRDGQYLTRDGTWVTLADFADNIILADPKPSYPTYAGTGAPRGGFGFNIIVGDTAANYASSTPYTISDLTLKVGGVEYAATNAVPEPTTFAIWGLLGGLGMIAVRRRRRVV